jgi:hypothetical protein
MRTRDGSRRWEKRDKKRNKKKYGMRIRGKSIKDTILPTIKKKRKRGKKK